MNKLDKQMKENGILKYSKEEYLKLIEEREPICLAYMVDKDKIIMCDNSRGEAFVEEFKKEDSDYAIAWAKGDIEYDTYLNDKKTFDLIKYFKEEEIDFGKAVPFEDYGSDEDAEYGLLNSFSSFYKNGLEKMGIDVENITCQEISAGKYELEVSFDDNNYKIYDIRAWESRPQVIDNFKDIINDKEQYLSKEEGMVL